MADNWVHGGPAGLIDASYVWLPIHFGADAVTLERRTEWALNDPFAPALCQAQAGVPLSLQECSASTSQTWRTPSARGVGPVQLEGTDLCATIRGDTGDIEPWLTLGECSTSYNVSDKLVETSGAGRCWDVTGCGSEECVGERLGLCACNDVHPNQRFLTNAAGQIKSAINGKCVSACPPAPTVQLHAVLGESAAFIPWKPSASSA